MKAEVHHSYAHSLFSGTHPRLEASRDLVVRVSRSAIRGADLRIQRRALEPVAPRSVWQRGPDALGGGTRCAGLIALVRLASVARLDRASTSLRAILLGPPAGARARDHALRFEGLLDELRKRDGDLDDLVEWLLRASPRPDEITRERLSLARSLDMVERFGAAHGAFA